MPSTLKYLMPSLLFASVLMACSPASVPHQEVANESTHTEIWSLNSLTSLNGYSVNAFGNPTQKNTKLGNVVHFDGDGDRLLVHNNPLGASTRFTIEVLLNPADVFPNNWEPRFFHIEALDNPNRRVTIELRLNDQQQWYLDAYIKSEQGQLALIDSTKVHPVNQWAHVAITYSEGVLTTFVNGRKELSGAVEYLPIDTHALTSIGARMNQVHWFNGDIAQVAITHKALRPEYFNLLPKLSQ